MKQFVTLFLSLLSLTSLSQDKTTTISIRGNLSSHNNVKIQFKNNEVRIDTSTNMYQAFNRENSYIIQPNEEIKQLGEYSPKDFEKMRSKLEKAMCFSDEIFVLVLEEGEQHKILLKNVTACCPEEYKTIIFGLNELANAQ